MKILNGILSKIPNYACAMNKAINSLTFSISGLSKIHKSHIIANISHDANKKAIVIASNEQESKILYNNLKNYGVNALHYPIKDFCLKSTEVISHEDEHERLKILYNFLNKNYDVIVVSAEAALQYTIPPENLLQNSFKLCKNQTMDANLLKDKLVSNCYSHAESVEGQGQFTIKNNIVDFFPINSERPIRIEFSGQKILSMWQFDVESQRRAADVDDCVVIPASEVVCNDFDDLYKKINDIIQKSDKISEKSMEVLKNEADILSKGKRVSNMDKFISLIYSKTCTMLDYIDTGTIIFVSEPDSLADDLTSTEKLWLEDLEIYLSQGVLCKRLSSFSKNLDDFKSSICKYNPIYLCKKLSNMSKNICNININSSKIKPLNGDFNSIVDEIKLYNEKNKCIVFAGEKKFASNLSNTLGDMGVKNKFLDNFDEDKKLFLGNNVIITTGTLSSGFYYEHSDVMVITISDAVLDVENVHKGKSKNFNLFSLDDLQKGSYVVHEKHGIGIFDGIVQINSQGIIRDYVKLVYDKNDTLYVPITQMHMISKYIGHSENSRVKLNSLGNSDWQKIKHKVKKAVKNIADDLLKIYFERMNAKGFPFPKDDVNQKLFESNFKYQETHDQLKSIREIKSDMEKNIPMDRLLCGDVGFGKTEVALRAAFKCVNAHKQCAMLIPTTILAWQHFQTVVKRFAGFDVKIELLSRFRTVSQQNKILRDLALGNIDFVIGTHRLIQKDVKFKDLGLVIIDEEQRFGVEHKEKFKKIAKDVDVLMLSATPIPRTLNMALSEIRDMSIIEEPPKNRRPVHTYVLEYDEHIIFKAIAKEIARDGQVYYLHNIIENIVEVADKITSNVSGARVGIIHGQMSENQLSDMWEKMLSKEVNVLVCTTIIETGIDIPNVNTLIIDNADCMGLAQLYQIRGRVGRSDRKAYAYLTFRKNKQLSDISQKRLNAIKDFTEFGSGFKIAMRDLELRGAGNLIGAQQHGNMEAVGYEMYLRLLEDSVKKKKNPNIQADRKPDCAIDLRVQMFIPDNYIKNVNEKLEMYKKISSIKNFDEAHDMVDELTDRFGKIPKSVMNLIYVSLIKFKAHNMNIYEIKQKDNYIYLYQKNLDTKSLSPIIAKLKGLVTVSANKNPHLCIRTSSQNDVLNKLKIAFDVTTL